MTRNANQKERTEMTGTLPRRETVERRFFQFKQATTTTTKLNIVTTKTHKDNFKVHVAIQYYVSK